jgi:CRISPR/Cas system CMR subunit Cmr4 (Cas7 group RAMP superfamily)
VDAPAPVQPDAATPPPADAAIPVDAAVEVQPDAATSVLPAPSRNQDAAWLLVGGTLTFVTTAIVLAYAAESTETDIEDLYLSLNGVQFDAKTQERYDELVRQGNRYQYLSWISFGVAGGMAIGATVMFWKHHKETKVAPIITPNSAGVSVRF